MYKACWACLERRNEFCFGNLSLLRVVGELSFEGQIGLCQAEIGLCQGKNLAYQKSNYMLLRLEAYDARMRGTEQMVRSSLGFSLQMLGLQLASENPLSV